ncbi:MAG: HAD family hydrolase [Melioribacteraceae bacterium]|jgi:D,D-heptose 1,7-bisphosphate phosphatase|nr:HAD family hydrolase [Melioribacteraceae bacterium]
MSSPALFLDRDGTINEDTGYVKNPDEITILPGVPEGIRKLKEQFGFKMIVISNQAGISKGLMTREDVELVNARINELLNTEGAYIDDYLYCPYHPDFDPPEKTICRKPSPMMIIEAAKLHDVDLSASYMIGDRASDIEAGINANVKTILLKSELFESSINNLHNQGKKPNFVAANFNEACDYIIKNSFGGI